ncbi:MAG: hypothetical protein ACYCZ6_04475 [Polaromonas sp.]
MAPTLVASRTALPPEGAGLAWGGPALRPLAPTLVAAHPLLPPVWGRPAGTRVAETFLAFST